VRIHLARRCGHDFGRVTAAAIARRRLDTQEKRSAAALRPPASQPSARRRAVAPVLDGKAFHQVSLLPRDHDPGHEAERRNDGDDETEAVREQRDAQLEQHERQVDRIPADAIRAVAHDSRSRLVAWHRRSGRLEGATRRDEEHDGEDQQHDAAGNADRSWDEVVRPQNVANQSDHNRREKDAGRPDEPRVRHG